MNRFYGIFVEFFSGWRKCHLKVYHLISTSKYGLMEKMPASLITYLPLTISCHNEHREEVSFKLRREICIAIRNEMSLAEITGSTCNYLTGRR